MLTAFSGSKSLKAIQFRTYRVQITKSIPDSDVADWDMFDLPVLAGPGEYDRIERYVAHHRPGWNLLGAIDVEIIGDEF